MAFSPEVQQAIAKAAAERGVDPSLANAFARIESGGDPRARTPSGTYKGLFQLSDSEFRKHGGGDIDNPLDNARAFIAKVVSETDGFRKRTGRTPTAADLYMVHQQGEGGYAAHTARPESPAWQNMASTAEGRQKGAEWAKAAIWGNLTPEAKARFGSVDNITSGDFLSFWGDRVAQMGGGSAGPAVASAAPASNRTANSEAGPSLPLVGGIPGLPEGVKAAFAPDRYAMEREALAGLKPAAAPQTNDADTINRAIVAQLLGQRIA